MESDIKFLESYVEVQKQSYYPSPGTSIDRSVTFNFQVKAVFDPFFQEFERLLAKGRTTFYNALPQF
jgi:hypothetical protein